jgi:ATP-dependent Clp protease ATP-binding subunit ClpB
LGDNRKVDFSRALIFMTSNLGASEMSALMSPRLGFNACDPARQSQNGVIDEKMNGKLARSGTDAARRKFTPEFINRLDKIVTFKPLGTSELRRILDIELNMVQQRIFNTSPEKSFVFKASSAAKDFLLKEGTDFKYGARHLKRAIERLLVQPMSNLIATDQVRGGDCVFVDFSDDCAGLTFLKEAEGLAVHAMADLVDRSISMPAFAFATGAYIEAAKVQSARSSKRA